MKDYEIKIIKYYAVNGNPKNKVWATTKKKAQNLAPKGAKLTFLQSEKINVEL